MDVFLWIGWIIAIVVAVFSVWMLVAGLVAARSPDWEEAMYAAGVEELTARGLIGRKVSTAEERIINDLLGANPSHPDAAIDARLLQGIRALTHESDEEISRLLQMREILLADAVTKQWRSVERITNPNFLAKAWHIRRAISAIQVALIGLKWFAPRFASRTRRIGEKYLSTSTLIGVWAGLLYWGFSQLGGPGKSSDWLSIVGIVVTFACAIGLAAAVCQQLFAVASVWYGPPASWNRKGIFSALVASCLFFTVVLLAWTGTLPRAAAQVSTWLMDWVVSLNAEKPIGGALLLGLFLTAIWFLIRRVQAKHLKLPDRIDSGLVALVLVSLSALVSVWLVGAPEPWPSIFLCSFGVTAFTLGAFSCTVSCISWVRDYRFLKQNQVHVPRRGFRKWALYAWLGTSVTVFVASQLVALFNPNSSTNSAGQIVNLVLALLILVLFVSFIPGVVVSILVLRRLSKIARLTRTLKREPE